MDSCKKDEPINFETRRIEKSLSQLGAKVANAQAILVDVQQELEELYISLDDGDRTT